MSLIPGDGIGPEVADSVVKIFDAAGAPISWESINIKNPVPDATGSILNKEGLEALKRTKIGLKGPTTTPIGGGHTSINVSLRKELDLFANVRPCKSIPNISKLYSDVDVVTIRENTEGEYSGKEHEVVPGVIENLKIISAHACERIAEYAFKYTRSHKRKHVAALHKASVMKMGDGLFLKKCREVAEKYPDIKYWEKSIDTGCGLLVSDPSTFDVMVMPNLYGDIMSDVCSGLIGGLGLTPSANLGAQYAVFEAVHGSAPDIAGKNKANPTALLLSAVMMLRHLEHFETAEKIEKAIFKTLSAGVTITGDLGGKASTTEYTQAVINAL